MMFVSRYTLVTVGCCLALAGCTQGNAGMPAPPPPVVSVSSPLELDVTDYNNFNGRTAAVDSVRVRAHVWGYLHKINFREGSKVNKDDVLFEIDSRTYQSELDRAEANLMQAKARRDRLQADLERGRRLLSQRGIGQEEFDKLAGDRAESDAAVKVSEANRSTALLNLEYTRVRAPISGVVSRALVTVGNVVQSGEMGGTILTSIVSIDPMYVYFDVDDLTFLRVNQLTRESANANAVPHVFMGLPTEAGFPRVGTLDFVDNQIDPGTGTIKMRGVFANKDNAFTAGLFVRVRVPLGRPHRASLITDRAVDTDQGQKVVYVVGADAVVEKRPVRLGRLHEGMREIESGLTSGERIVIDGIQRVRHGAKVDPRVVAMPLGTRATSEVPAVPKRGAADAGEQKPK